MVAQPVQIMLILLVTTDNLIDETALTTCGRPRQVSLFYLNNRDLCAGDQNILDTLPGALNL